jgi:hypothetical protein
MFRLLTPLLISGSLGWLVLRLFFRPLGVWLRIPFYLAFGVPIGAGLFGISSLVTFLVWRAGPAPIAAAFLVPAALAAGAALLQSWGKLFQPMPLSYGSADPGGSADRGGIPALLAIVLLVTCFAATLLLADSYVTLPHGMWDANAIWNARARVMFRAPGHWRDVLLPAHPHPDYPLTLSMLVYAGWAMLGSEARSVPFSLGVAFLYAGAAVVGVGLAIWKSIGWGLAAASLILCSIGYVSLAGWQYADTPLSVLIVASVVLFTLAYRNEKVSQPVLALAGGAAALCGWIKNEGTPILFGFIFGLTLGCILLRRTEGWLRQVGSFCAGAVLPVAIMQYYRSLTPPNDIVHSALAGGTWQKLADLHRWLTIAKSDGAAWWSAPGTILPLAIFLLFVWIVAGIRVEANLRLPLIAGLGALLSVAAGHFAAYLVSPHPLAWHLNSSVDRVALQLMPTLVFLSFGLVRSDFLTGKTKVARGAEESADDSAPAAAAPAFDPGTGLPGAPSCPSSEAVEPDRSGIFANSGPHPKSKAAPKKKAASKKKR